jgi:hypothetical protein
MRNALFWAVKHQVVVISHRCFGTTYGSHFQGSRIQVDIQDRSLAEGTKSRLGIPCSIYIVIKKANYLNNEK